MRETMSRLGGTGLPEAELSKLALFLRTRLVPPVRSERTLTAQEEKGRAIFTSETAGCSGCHRLENDASDRTLHEVGSRPTNHAASTVRTPPLQWNVASAT